MAWSPRTGPLPLTGVPCTAMTELSRERTDLLESLGRHRYFLRFTVQGLTDEQARQTPTASALSLGGLIKHVAATERQWADFIVRGPEAMGSFDADIYPGGEIPEELTAAWAGAFKLLPEETLEGVLAEYEKVAEATDELTRTVDLDSDHELPKAPWFRPGARWSTRRCLLHIIAETSQHSGHADILRETMDGQKTMG